MRALASPLTPSSHQKTLKVHRLGVTMAGGFGPKARRLGRQTKKGKVCVGAYILSF